MQRLKSRLSRLIPRRIIEARSAPLFEKKSLHEVKLRAYFDGFKLSKEIAPVNRPVCILLYTNRSGSNMVGEYLRATHCFSGFRESLNHRRITKISDQENLRSFADYLQWLLSTSDNDNTIFGMKASCEQAMMLYRSGALPNLFNDVRWITIQRNNVLGQAISFSIATQTKQWTSGDQLLTREVEYNFEDINERLRILSESNTNANVFCAMFGIEPYRIIYEDFIADPKLGARNLSASMGINHVEFDDSLLTMKKQRNDLNKQYEEQFIADYKKRLSSRLGKIS